MCCYVYIKRHPFCFCTIKFQASKTSKLLWPCQAIAQDLAIKCGMPHIPSQNTGFSKEWIIKRQIVISRDSLQMDWVCTNK